jgi:hypothetical protein
MSSVWVWFGAVAAVGKTLAACWLIAKPDHSGTANANAKMGAHVDAILFLISKTLYIRQASSVMKKR